MGMNEYTKDKSGEHLWVKWNGMATTYALPLANVCSTRLQDAMHLCIASYFEHLLTKQIFTLSTSYEAVLKNATTVRILTTWKITVCNLL